MDKVIDYSTDLSKLSLQQLMALRDMARTHRLNLQAEYDECLNHEQQIWAKIALKEVRGDREGSIAPA